MSDPAFLDNIQGDIISGLPKRTETFSFFQIDDARIPEFRTQLAQLVPLITTTTQVRSDRKKIDDSKRSAARDHVEPSRLTLSGVNVSFSHTGLVKLGITDDTGDEAFEAGQLKQAEALQDQGTKVGNQFVPDWVPAFKDSIHGVFLVTGDSHETVETQLAKVLQIFHANSFDASLHETLRIVGDVRPGSEKGHEHFGFLDGISDPAIRDVDTTPFPGQETIAQGIVLLGRDGDALQASRPPWALDGSFLAFRYLFQLVPEFDRFLTRNPIPNLQPNKGSELLGARLVGRWKSGAPIDIAVDQDDPDLAADPQRNNDFRFDFPNDQQTQDRCPFAAHIRKTNPRADLQDPHPPNSPSGIPTEPNRIIRHGIQFGPEVTDEEKELGKTLHGRGLLFVAYQSNLLKGFEFIQKSWANETGFPPFKDNVPEPGFDPIIGQDFSKPGGRTIVGTDPKAQDAALTLDAHWVIPRGGEYFFSPSISVLKDKFATGGNTTAQNGGASEL